MVPMIDIKLALVVYDSMNMSITTMTYFGRQWNSSSWPFSMKELSTVLRICLFLCQEVCKRLQVKCPACVPVLLFCQGFCSISLFWSLEQIWLFWILFLRARVLSRNPKVKSPRYATRAWQKNSATSQLSCLSARKFRRWSLTCVDETINWASL